MIKKHISKRTSLPVALMLKKALRGRKTGYKIGAPTHVETLVTLSHKIPDSHIAVKVDFDDKIDDISKENIKARAEARKPQARTTYKMIQAYVEEHYGFKVHTAYIAEVKRNLGLPMYDCPNAVEFRTHESQHPTAQMVVAITDALRQYAVI